MVAVVTSDNLSNNPAINVQALSNKIQALFTAASAKHAFIQSVAANDYYGNPQVTLVFQLNLNPTASYGNPFLVIQISSSLQISYWLYTNWDTNAHTGTNGTSQYQGGAQLTNQALTLTCYTSDVSEFCFLFLNQQSMRNVIAYIKPALLRSGVDENTAPAVMIPYNPALSQFLLSNLNQYQNGQSINLNSSLHRSEMSNPSPLANPPGSESDAEPGVTFYNANGYGIFGISSDDLCSGCFTGKYFTEPAPVVPGVNEYVCVDPVSGGLGIRTVHSGT